MLGQYVLRKSVFKENGSGTDVSIFDFDFQYLPTVVALAGYYATVVFSNNPGWRITNAPIFAGVSMLQVAFLIFSVCFSEAPYAETLFYVLGAGWLTLAVGIFSFKSSDGFWNFEEVENAEGNEQEQTNGGTNEEKTESP
jgi:hypothetical protein